MTTAVEEAFTEELEAHAIDQIVAGNPDTLIKKFKHVIDLVDPGSLVLRAGRGAVSQSGHTCHRPAEPGGDLRP